MPNSISSEQLYGIASAIRAILDEVDRSSWGEPWQAFPRGACGIVSELVGRYLSEIHHVEILYVAARKGTYTHAWIEVSSLIIDITADQFGEPPVIVLSDSPWHGEWHRDSTRPCVCTEEGWPYYPAAAWEAILKGMRFRCSS